MNLTKLQKKFLPWIGCQTVVTGKTAEIENRFHVRKVMSQLVGKDEDEIRYENKNKEVIIIHLLDICGWI